MNTKSVTDKHLATLKTEALAVLRSAKQFDGCSDDEIVEHVLSYGHTKKNWIADSWLDCIVSSFSQNVSIAPSPESQAWSSMEGGHVLWDSRKAEALARQTAAKCGIALKY